MRILATQYSLPTRSFEIYVSGCSANPHCEGCHNPESWDFSRGEEYDYLYYSKKIVPKVNEFSDLVDNIFILGGEPLDQRQVELKQLLFDLKILKKPIWLFTRYSIEDIPRSIKRAVSYIKCGRYIEEYRTKNNLQYGINLATSNQKIYKRGVDYK